MREQVKYFFEWADDISGSYAYFFPEQDPTRFTDYFECATSGWVGVSGEQTTLLCFQPSRSTKLLDQVIWMSCVSSERTTKSFEQVDVFSEQATKAFDELVFSTNGQPSSSNECIFLPNGGPKPFKQVQIFFKRLTNGL